MTTLTDFPAPLGMLAEITHRCPLACPYCSNPLTLEDKAAELDSETWGRLFREAAALGILQLHLSGGEPASRSDLIEITGFAHQAGLYTNLITSGLGLTGDRLSALAVAGLDHVQISIQDSEASSADRIAGFPGGHGRKLAIARLVVRSGLALTINVVLHRANIAHMAELVALAEELGAGRVEIAHVQYSGWALHNRDALMPTAAQVKAAATSLAALREEYTGRLVIDFVAPDYYARRPKACMGGWARRSLNVSPSGLVLPCHAAATIPSLTFWSAREYSLADIWNNSPAFVAFRGTEWMSEPCRSCNHRNVDFGGCRCQAMAIVGDATATDPACEFSPHHKTLVNIAKACGEGGDIPYHYRGRGIGPVGAKKTR